MANKDILPATIANILILIKTATNFASNTARQSKAFTEIPIRITKIINPDPSSATDQLQKWFNTYIKTGAPAAGTATISTTFTTIQEWRNNFFVVRTQLLANTSPAAIEALDKWFTKYTTYKVTGKGKW